jgi:Domain of unknown function (DUF4326)
MPQRIQLSRRRGWRKPSDAIVISRPSKWGNPFRIDASTSRTEAIERYAAALAEGSDVLPFTVADVVRELAGHDLACWCSLDVPCHGDVLLEIANAAPLRR